ncbi:tripartite tricarboxylate transporter substrate binding protein [Ramlibacter sp. G-1-2-2]|uniref:Tripartite tricarboxylate transporter substrate binding protein n=2 Tax=Ramlibacter agri TaxID=2728837 RepID=A0A848HA27_9BURK|nr:tripartite tricarboxylate transporter substrate binding protein [Ramlibacter agri]
MNRRTFAAAGLACAGVPAWAQPSWPSRPIRIITPSPVGVGSDLFARQYAERLTHALGVAVLVENRPGAASVLGTDAVAKAAPDGYTVLFSTSNPFTMTPFLLKKLPYDAQADLQPVTQALRGGSFIVANNAFPARTIGELIARAKAAPGKISYASYGPGSTAHLGMELVQDAAGIELLHVPYKQGAITDVIGGQVMLGFEPPVSALPHIRAGRLKVLAYTGGQRSAAAPEVPTVAETLPGVEVLTWLGFWVPAKTPDAVVQRLYREVTAINNSPEMRKYIADQGLEPAPATPQETAAVVRKDAEVMGRLIKAKNISLD